MIISSMYNIFLFLLITYLYYQFLYPTLTIEINNNEQMKQSYQKNKLISMCMYLGCIIVTQFFMNASMIKSICKSNISETMKIAFLSTFFPWFLLFGASILIILIFPSIIHIFANIIGYIWISSNSNKLLINMLLDPKIDLKIQNSNELDEKSKIALETTSTTLKQLYGNSSILINEIIPSNFEEYWNILIPLMKSNQSIQENKINLWKLIVQRNKIGEACWLLYSGILVSSIVQMKLSEISCSKDPVIMEQEYKQFLEEEQKKLDQEKNAETQYDITN